MIMRASRFAVAGGVLFLSACSGESIFFAPDGGGGFDTNAINSVEGGGFFGFDEVLANGADGPAGTPPGGPTFPNFKGVGGGIVTASDYPVLIDPEPAVDHIVPLTMPSTGTATYRGVLLMVDLSDDAGGYTGNTTFVADHGAGTVTGEAGEIGYYLRDQSDPTAFPTLDKTLSGTLALSDGKLFDVSMPEVSFTGMIGTLSGTLTGDGMTVDITTGLGGGFLDDAGQPLLALDGDENGQMTSQGNVVPSTIDDGSGVSGLRSTLYAN